MQKVRFVGLEIKDRENSQELAHTEFPLPKSSWDWSDRDDSPRAPHSGSHQFL